MSCSAAIVVLVLTASIGLMAAYPIYDYNDGDDNVMVLLVAPEHGTSSDYQSGMIRRPRSFHVHSTVRWTSKMGSQRRQHKDNIHKKTSGKDLDDGESVFIKTLKDRLTKRFVAPDRMRDFGTDAIVGYDNAGFDY